MITAQSIKFLLKNPTKLLFYLLVVVMPFITTSFTNESYEFPKVTFLYLVGGLFVISFAWDAINQKISVQFDKRMQIVFAYFSIFILSTAFSQDLYTSIFGYFSRFNGGMVSLFIYVPIFIYTVTWSDSESKRFIRVLTLSSIPVVLVSLIQILDPSITRIYSTIGQPNWLSMYLSTVLIVSMYILLNSENKREVFFYFIYLVFTFLSFWRTYSNSGYIGFGVGILVLLAMNYKIVLIKKYLILGVLVSFLIISLLNFNYFKGRMLDVFEDFSGLVTSTIRVYADSNYVYSDTGGIRLGMWEGSIRLALSSAKVFLIGSGPETFPYAFQPYRPVELNYSSEWEYILNKPHNYYLEILTEQGAVSLILYLCIGYFALKKKHLLYSAVLVSYFVCNIFGWPSTYNELLYWVFLGLSFRLEIKHV